MIDYDCIDCKHKGKDFNRQEPCVSCLEFPIGDKGHWEPIIEGLKTVTTKTLEQLEKDAVALAEEIKKLKEEQSKPKTFFPVDTLVEVSNSSTDAWKLRFFKQIVKDSAGNFQCFYDGKSSKTANKPDRGMHWDYLRFPEQTPQPWFGGEAPVSKDIKVKIWTRNGNTTTSTECCGGLRWTHYENPADIIAYQILEQTVE